ncbi:MAG: hypothetical protein IJF78_09190 [Clostridia bacterium]|nr:hypothetical protein [Clostridia bacterium]
MKKRLTALLLAGLLLALPSCSKENPDNPAGADTAAAGETVEKAEMLTHIFRGESLTLPEDYRIREDMAPSYDKETGNITLMASWWEEILDEEGNFVDSISHYYMLTLAPDSTVVSKEEITFGDGVYPQNLTQVNGTTYYMSNEFDQATYEETFNLYVVKDGTATAVEDLARFFSSAGSEEMRWFYIQYMAVDKDGYVYLGADQEIAVLNPDLTLAFTVTADNWINTMTASPDGTVYISSYMDGGYGLTPIDRDKKSFGEAVTLGNSSNMREMFFAGGYDLYYTTDDGVYGYNFAEPAEDGTVGEGENVLIMSYQNSDVTEDTFDILSVVDSETFLVSERDPVTYDSTVAVYKKAADVDLSSVHVIEMACIYPNYNLPASVVQFNKDNPGSRIIISDYSQYNTDEDYMAGANKLATDIVNGLYKPDIVIGNTGDAFVQQILEKSLYTDLYTFLDKDDRINRNTVFSSVLYSYETDDGKLWGLPSEFSVSTLIAPKAVMGDRTSWTFTEMLDFAMNLPAGVSLMEDLTQENAMHYLLGGSGYAAFVDQKNASCSFTSPEFIKYLEYIRTLPASSPSYEERPDDYYETLYLARHNGQVALDAVGLSDPHDWVSLEAAFNTKDYVLIGFPAENGDKGARISYSDSYIITSFCEYPDEAWAFLKTIIHPEFDEMRERYHGINSFPIVRGLCEEMAEQYKEYEYDIYFSGGASWGSYDPENPDTSELREPGIRTYFTDADKTALLDYLENGVGQRTSAQVSDEITAIVNEEISTYLGGVKDAKTCADVIQSRVKLWLAEHE